MITLLLPPPAFACFASYGWASHVAVYISEAGEGCRAEARWAKAGHYPHELRLGEPSCLAQREG